MNVILVRHGRAQRPASGAELPEPLIPLSPDGAAAVRALAGMLASRESAVMRILTSTKTRAVETAQLIAQAFRVAAVEELDSLSEDSFDYDDVVGYIGRECSGEKSVIIVSHAPVLSDLAFTFVPRTELPSISFAPAAAACIEFDAAPGRGAGRLAYRIDPES